MTIEKLKSGSYRVTQTKDKIRYRVTFDHKPTKKEAEDAIFQKMISQGERPNGILTFEDAAKIYIESKRNVLSPSTITGYIALKNNLPEWFAKLQVDSVTQLHINKLVNEKSLTCSPKSVRNYHGLISAILGTFRPEMHIYTTLPQKIKKEPYIPSDEDVKRLLEALKATDAYVPVCLACMGMRRGEILALTPEDVEGNVVHITKAIAMGPDRKPVIKSTKTTESTRDIIIPQEVADQIRAQGFVYRGHHQYATKKMRDIEKQLGIPHFPLHKLRHYFATKMLTLTDSQTVQALGGWKTDSVMKTVYAHSMKAEQEKAKRLAVDQFSKSIF